MYGHIDIAEELIKRGANLDAINHNGYTALMVSTWDFDEQVDGAEVIEMTKFLIQSGCSTDISVGDHTFLNDLPAELRIEMEDYIDSLAPKPAKKERKEEM